MLRSGTPALERNPTHAALCTPNEVQEEALQKLSPCDVAALKKCLDENKGDHKKVCPLSRNGWSSFGLAGGHGLQGGRRAGAAPALSRAACPPARPSPHPAPTF